MPEFKIDCWEIDIQLYYLSKLGTSNLVILGLYFGGLQNYLRPWEEEFELTEKMMTFQQNKTAPTLGVKVRNMKMDLTFMALSVGSGNEY